MTLALTDWFTGRTRPVRVGWYEAETKRAGCWPMIHKRLWWTGRRWLWQDEVIRWRGLAVDPYGDHE